MLIFLNNKRPVQQDRTFKNSHTIKLFCNYFLCVHLSKVDILSWANRCAGMAADALSRMCSVTVDIQMCRTSFLTESTFWGTIWTISLKKCSRKDWQNRKNSTHWAKKLTEKSFLCTHTDHNKDQ